MNKKLLSILSLAFSMSVFAQTFSDDFESYTVGSYLGPQSPNWTTWTASQEGGSEDVLVSSANASSGTKALYFSSTAANGGPQDVVLPFDQVYNSGNFTFEANFFVESNKGAYFNLQGTNIVAQVWALDCYMLQDGTMKLSNSGTPYINANYPVAQWFNLRIEMDLTSNVWELFIDNVSMGSFSNPTGSIGILDLYPVNPAGEGGNGQSGFYVDDVSYNHISASLPALNGGVTFVDQLSGIAGLTSNVSATVRNLGMNNITSFDITYDYAGNQVTESVGPISLASLATYNHTFAAPVSVAAGSNTLTVTVSNVNGLGADNDPSDDSKVITVNPIVPAAGKVVVGEEATGTWCQWCPRGAVYMDLYEQEFGPYWAGIAVHNGDPMTVTDYDTGIGALIGGYPSALVDRGVDVDPSGMYSDFLTRLQTPPAAFIVNGANWNATTRVLDVSISADFQIAANSNYKIACVLTEDGVTGSGAGWSQSNAYAGGGNGVMGGYETLPNPVPAAQMVYDHVARVIAPGFGGLTNSFPATVNSGETHTVNFTFNLPAGWDENNIHIVGMLIAPNGRIDNAGKATIAEAVANGYVDGTSAGITELDEQIDDLFKVYPNPASDFTVVGLNLKKDAEVSLQLIDVTGKVIASKNYGSLNGASEIVLGTSELTSGVYIIELTVNNEKHTKKLIVE